MVKAPGKDAVLAIDVELSVGKARVVQACFCCGASLSSFDVTVGATTPTVTPPGTEAGIEPTITDAEGRG